MITESGARRRLNLANFSQIFQGRQVNILRGNFNYDFFTYSVLKSLFLKKNEVIFSKRLSFDLYQKGLVYSQFKTDKYKPGPQSNKVFPLVSPPPDLLMLIPLLLSLLIWSSVSTSRLGSLCVAKQPVGLELAIFWSWVQHFNPSDMPCNGVLTHHNKNTPQS